MPHKSKVNKKRKPSDPHTPRNQRQVCFNTYDDQGRLLTPRQVFKKLRVKRNEIEESLQKGSLSQDEKSERRQQIEVLSAEIEICDKYLQTESKRSSLNRAKRKRDSGVDKDYKEMESKITKLTSKFETLKKAIDSCLEELESMQSTCETTCNDERSQSGSSSTVDEVEEASPVRTRQRRTTRESSRNSENETEGRVSTVRSWLNSTIGWQDKK